MERKYLQVWREDKLWSQSDLAREAGVNRSIISRIESGKAVGRISTAKKIAGALGISPRQIVDFDELFAPKSPALTTFNRSAGLLQQAEMGMPVPTSVS